MRGSENENLGNVDQEKAIKEITFELSYRSENPRSTLGVNLNGKADNGFLFGISKIFDQISKKELSELLPGAFSYDEKKDSINVLRGNGKYNFLLDENNDGLRKLAKKAWSSY